MKLADGRTVHGNRPGTVGLPVPGTCGQDRRSRHGARSPRRERRGDPVKGPQVMVGYLNRPEATAKVLKDGWYMTGDLGYVDAEGFLKITDRLSRFSKIAGEMVPHMAIESAIMETYRRRRASRRRDRRSRSQARRAALRRSTPSWACRPTRFTRRLTGRSLPRLWIPSLRDFIRVQEIPIRVRARSIFAGFASWHDASSPSMPDAHDSLISRHLPASARVHLQDSSFKIERSGRTDKDGGEISSCESCQGLMRVRSTSSIGAAALS